jgi:hypothetical protein
MMDWYTADKINRFEYERRLRDAERERMVARARRGDTEATRTVAEPRPTGLLRRLILTLGLTTR